MITMSIKSKVYGEVNYFIDDDDFEKISKYNWCLSYDKKLDGFYVRSTCKNIKIHRLITDCPSDKVVDHINHNTLDNRKENLRICTRSENLRNCKKYKNGYVSKYKGLNLLPSGNFQVRIQYNKKPLWLGTYKTEKEAAEIYNKKALELFGEFANLNIIDEVTK